MSAEHLVEYICGRLRRERVPFGANDNIAANLSGIEVKGIEQAVEGCIERLLEALLIDWENDPNTRETTKRIARMLVCEVAHGRFTDKPKITKFPNTKQLDELYAVGPISVRSLCAHHFAPVLGQAWIGVVPGQHLLGLSKFARLTEWIFARPTMQEEAIIQLADLLQDELQPRGLAVSVRAQHHCMLWRGVRECSTAMTTNVMRGVFYENEAARAEFLAGIRGQGA